MSRLTPSHFYGDEDKANLVGSLGLTRREAEVAKWMAEGKSNYEIGVILGACTGTICKHVEHILAKLSVENRTAAAAVVLRSILYGVSIEIGAFGIACDGLWTYLRPLTIG